MKLKKWVSVTGARRIQVDPPVTPRAPRTTVPSEI